MIKQFLSLYLLKRSAITLPYNLEVVPVYSALHRHLDLHFFLYHSLQNEIGVNLRSVINRSIQ